MSDDVKESLVTLLNKARFVGVRQIRVEAVGGWAESHVKKLIYNIAESPAALALLSAVREEGKQEAIREVQGVIDHIPKKYVVQCCEGCVPENVFGTLAVSVSNLRSAVKSAHATGYQEGLEAAAKRIYEYYKLNPGSLIGVALLRLRDDIAALSPKPLAATRPTPDDMLDKFKACHRALRPLFDASNHINPDSDPEKEHRFTFTTRELQAASKAYCEAGLPRRSPEELDAMVDMMRREQTPDGGGEGVKFFTDESHAVPDNVPIPNKISMSVEVIHRPGTSTPQPVSDAAGGDDRGMEFICPSCFCTTYAKEGPYALCWGDECDFKCKIGDATAFRQLKATPAQPPATEPQPPDGEYVSVTGNASVDNLLWRTGGKPKPTTPEDSMTRPLTEAIPTLLEERGALVCSADCSEMELAFARLERRFFVGEDGIGYVVRPKRWRHTAEQCVTVMPIVDDPEDKLDPEDVKFLGLLHAAKYGTPFPTPPDRRDAKGEFEPKFKCPECGCEKCYRAADGFTACSSGECGWSGLPRDCGLAPPASAAPEQAVSGWAELDNCPNDPARKADFIAGWNAGCRAQISYDEKQPKPSHPSPSPADRDKVADALEAYRKHKSAVAAKKPRESPLWYSNPGAGLADGGSYDLSEVVHTLADAYLESSDAMGRLMEACEPFAKAAGDDWLNRFDDNLTRDIGRLNYDSGLFYADLAELRSALANARKGGV